MGKEIEIKLAAPDAAAEVPPFFVQPALSSSTAASPIESIRFIIVSSLCTESVLCFFFALGSICC